MIRTESLQQQKVDNLLLLDLLEERKSPRFVLRFRATFCIRTAEGLGPLDQHTPTKRSSLGDRAFPVAAARAWNTAGFPANSFI